MGTTKIEWADSVWNPVTGCTKISPGCQNCYAEKMTRRFWRIWRCLAPPNHFGVTWHTNKLDQPLRWHKPRRIFVCSMGDLFHEAVPFEFIDKVMYTISECDARFKGAGKCNHQFLILTKRPQRMKEFFVDYFYKSYAKEGMRWEGQDRLWLGVSVENQKTADERIPILLQIPAAIKFVSIEPILGEIDLTNWILSGDCHCGALTADDCHCFPYPGKNLDWIIIGCESGARRRHISLKAIRNVAQQVTAAGVPLFVKQIEMWGLVKNGHLFESQSEAQRLIGQQKVKQFVIHDKNKFPADLQVQEYPK